MEERICPSTRHQPISMAPSLTKHNRTFGFSLPLIKFFLFSSSNAVNPIILSRLGQIRSSPCCSAFEGTSFKSLVVGFYVAGPFVRVCVP